MEIYGREVGFLRSVLANCMIAEKAPDGDMGRFVSELLQSPNYNITQRAAATMMVALSSGYEQAKAFREPGYRPRPLTEAEVLSLEPKEFNALFDEALNLFFLDGKTSVEAEPIPDKKGKKTEE